MLRLKWLSDEGRALVGYLLLTLIITFPLVFQLHHMLPLGNGDTYTAIWQNWWMRESLVNGKNLEHADILFHPTGLDTTLQPRRWVTFPIWLIFYEIFGEPAAYNLTIILQTIIRAYAMYHLIYLLIPDRRSAWLGGAIFASSPTILTTGLSQPNTGSVEFIIIFMICWVITLRYLANDKDDDDVKRIKTIGLMILAAVAFSAALYQNIKIGVLTIFLGGGYFLWQFIIGKYWKQRSIVIGIIVFTMVSIMLSIPILLPVLNYTHLQDAIYQFNPEDKGLDVLLYIKPYLQEPFFYSKFISTLTGDDVLKQLPSGTSNLSFMSIVIALLGMGYLIKQKQKQLIWVILLIVFFLLSLGPTIYFNGQPLDMYWTPYRLLLQTPFEPIFTALRAPFRFQILFLFCFAILFAYGWLSLQTKLKAIRYRSILYGVTMIVIILEIGIFPLSRLESNILSSYQYLDTLPDDGAIIHVPTGRHYAKIYMYAQIFHHRPIAEGMTARMPPDAFEYIELNLWLTQIRYNVFTVSMELRDHWEREIQQLLNHGYRYVVVVDTPLLHFSPLIPRIQPLYRDDYSSVYDLRDIRDNPPVDTTAFN